MSPTPSPVQPIITGLSNAAVQISAHPPNAPWVSKAIELSNHPLPGNPGGLGTLAHAFSTAGSAASQIATDVGGIAGHLNGYWQGKTGYTAAHVVSLTGYELGKVQPAFSAVASAISSHADALSTLESQRAGLVQDLNKVLATINAQSGSSSSDPFAAARNGAAAAKAAVSVINNLITVYNNFTKAVASLTQAFQTQANAAASVAGAATVINGSGGSAGNGAATASSQSGGLSLPPAGTAPSAVNTWWNRLSPAQQQQLATQNPQAIGALNGVPSAVRDYSNRIVLSGQITATQSQLSQAQAQLQTLQNAPLGPEGQPPPEIVDQASLVDKLQTQLNGQQALQNTIGPSSGQWPGQGSGPAAVLSAGQQPVWLLGTDTTTGTGHFALAVGANPDTADNVATLVPGVNTNLSTAPYYTNAADTILAAAQKADPNAATSVIVWDNYDAPTFTGSPSFPAFDSAAVNGAPALQQFQAGLYATNTSGDMTATIIGHSYGSTVLGEAAKLPGGLDATNVVAIGSPGMDVPNASSFPGATVFAAKDTNDIIAVTNNALGNYAHDALPTTPGYGSDIFNAGDGPKGPWYEGGYSIDAHMYYFNPSSPAVPNMGNIIAGNYSQVTAPGGQVPNPPYSGMKH